MRSPTLTPRSRALTALFLLGLASGLAQPSLAQTPQPAKRFGQGDELVQLDFTDVELAVVIDNIARITGKNFIYDDRVRGRVTIVSPSEVTVDQAYAVFESVLKVKGFTAVQGPGGAYKILPIRDAKESSIDTIRHDRPSPNRDTFVTRLVPLLYIDAEAITNTIKPLVSKDASMVAYPPTNTIIITDSESNIRRLMSILSAIDVESHKEEMAVIKVRYADANTLGEQISEIYEAEVTSTSTTTAAARRGRTARRAAAQAAAAASTGQRSKVRIITDERTNSLLVLAARSQLAEIRELVQQLDVPLLGGGRIHVYYLKHADAEELAETLEGMLTGQRPTSTAGGRTGAVTAQPQTLRSAVTELAEGITLNADPATNSLVIQASKEAYEILVSVIEQLDIPRPQVLVEALIMEVDITDAQELGVELTYTAVNGSRRFFFTTASQAAESIATTDTGGAVATFIKRGLDADGNPTSGEKGANYDAIIKAAAKDSNLNIVSAPHILTTDNEEAEIKIGNQIPIITSRVNSATGNTAGLASSVNVERQDIGVTLRVTPQISEGDTLRLKIFQEITDINKDLAPDVGNPEQVGVSLFNRKVENTVVVRDGETVVVGGLIGDRYNDSVQKVPWLGDIPVLGWAFKSTSKDLRKINLLVFLTPHIVRSAEEMELETIRKREEFQDDSGEQYKIDPETLAEQQDAKDKSSKWAKSNAPVVRSLRDHSIRYPAERKQELEEKQRAEDERLAAERAAALEAGRILYGVRVGLFRDETKAAETLTLLLDAGYDGSLVSGEADGDLVHEIVLGPFEDARSATEAARVLREVYRFTPSVTLLETGEAQP